MENNWFLFYSGVVHGPIPTSQVQKALNAQEVHPETLCWRKGMANWAPIQEWTNLSKTPVRPTNVVPRFQVTYGGETTSLLLEGEMIEHLHRLHQVAGVSIWSSQTNEWKPLADSKELLLRLGYPIRNHPRIPIVGSAFFQRDTQQVMELEEISEGGFGIRNAQNLKPKDTVGVTIKSMLISNPLHVAARVLYLKENGSAGLCFEQINSESLSLLLDYIRRYQSGHFEKTAAENELTPTRDFLADNEITEEIRLSQIQEVSGETKSEPVKMAKKVPAETSVQTLMTSSAEVPTEMALAAGTEVGFPQTRIIDAATQVLATAQIPIEATQFSADNPATSVVWYINHFGKKIGPLERADLIEKLGQLGEPAFANIWHTGMQTWKPVLNFPDLMADLNLPIRKMVRVPFMGELSLISDGKSEAFMVKSISEGGLGITGGNHLPAGNKFRAIVRSPVLPHPFAAEVYLAKVSESGEVAVRFLNIQPPALEMIKGYISNFSALPSSPSVLQGESTQLLRAS